jgi:hypothetical protein
MMSLSNRTQSDDKKSSINSFFTLTDDSGRDLTSVHNSRVSLVSTLTGDDYDSFADSMDFSFADSLEYSFADSLATLDCPFADCSSLLDGERGPPSRAPQRKSTLIVKRDSYKDAPDGGEHHHHQEEKNYGLLLSPPRAPNGKSTLIVKRVIYKDAPDGDEQNDLLGLSLLCS